MFYTMLRILGCKTKRRIAFLDGRFETWGKRSSFLSVSTSSKSTSLSPIWNWFETSFWRERVALVSFGGVFVNMGVKLCPDELAGGRWGMTTRCDTHAPPIISNWRNRKSLVQWHGRDGTCHSSDHRCKTVRQCLAALLVKRMGVVSVKDRSDIGILNITTQWHSGCSDLWCTVTS